MELLKFLAKKEVLALKREQEKLEKSLGVLKTWKNYQALYLSLTHVKNDEDQLGGLRRWHYLNHIERRIDKINSVLNSYGIALSKN